MASGLVVSFFHLWAFPGMSVWTIHGRSGLLPYGSGCLFLSCVSSCGLSPSWLWLSGISCVCLHALVRAQPFLRAARLWCPSGQRRKGFFPHPLLPSVASGFHVSHLVVFVFPLLRCCLYFRTPFGLASFLDKVVFVWMSVLGQTRGWGRCLCSCCSGLARLPGPGLEVMSWCLQESESPGTMTEVNISPSIITLNIMALILQSKGTVWLKGSRNTMHSSVVYKKHILGYLFPSLYSKVVSTFKVEMCFL